MYLPNIYSLVCVAELAGNHIRRNFRRKNRSTLKSDNTPVSEVDMAVHEMFMSWAKVLPNIGYISEEGDDFDRDCQSAIFVDPLDGTSAYLRGLSTVGIAISLMRRLDDTWWEPVIGVIHEPVTEWTWAATNTGQGFVQHGNSEDEPFSIAKTSDRPFKVTAVAWRNAPCRMEAIREALEKDPDMEHQSFGSTAIGGGLIASGLTNAVLFGGRSAVETAAMSLIVQGAGGVATDLSGAPLVKYELTEHDGKFDFLLPNGSIMSSSQALNDRLVAIVEQVRK